MGYVAISIVLISLLGFHLSYPATFYIFGRQTEIGISTELFTTIPLAIIGILGCKSFVKQEKVLSYIFLFFVIYSIAVGYVIHDTSLVLLKNPIALFLIMSGSYYLFKNHWDSLSKALPGGFIFVMLVFLIFLVYLYISGDYRYDLFGHEGSYLKRLRIGSVLPTEATLFLGIQFCYILYLYNTSYSRISKIIVYILFTWVLYSFFLFGARAGFMGIVIVMLIYFRKHQFTRTYWLILFVPLIIAFFGLFEVIVNVTAITTKEYEEITLSGRYHIYSYLIELIKDNPFIGIGAGEFYRSYMFSAPHNTLLGLGCETGLPTLLAYISFYVIFIFKILSYEDKIRQDSSLPPLLMNRTVNFFEMTLLVLAYVHFRGLFTDTFALKEQYYLVGAVLGIKEYFKIATVKGD